MIEDILYVLLGAFYVVLFVMVAMIPFFIYLYWLNNKQNRFFKKLGKELGLGYKSMGNKIKRDFPELNGFIDGIQCFIGARRTKGRYGTSAATRNHYPIILIQVAINPHLEGLKLDITGKQIKIWSQPAQTMNAETLTKLQRYAGEYGNIVVHQSSKGIIEVSILNELSNQKQYDKIKALIPLLLELALVINRNSKS